MLKEKKFYFQATGVGDSLWTNFSKLKEECCNLDDICDKNTFKKKDNIF